MKSQSKPCERWQESISLLAGGALAGPEKAEVEGHLAACPNCRERFAEFKKISAPLAGWERNFAHVEPGRAAELRWAQAIHHVADHRPSQVNPVKFSFDLLWRELIWPARRTWAGLAAVWLALLVFNHAQTEPRHSVMAAGAPPPAEMRLALREQRRVLDELIGPVPSAPPAEPPRRPNNQPRSERRSLAMA